MAEPKLWDQQKGETDGAYSHFLIYRNLGPARSIEAAYFLCSSIASNRAKSRRGSKPASNRASGQWAKESEQFNWQARAHAWDVKVFDEAGQRVVVNFVALLEQLSRRALEAMANPRVKPRGLKSIVEVVTVLGAYIPAETVANLSTDSRSNRAPAIGALPGERP